MLTQMRVINFNFFYLFRVLLYSVSFIYKQKFNLIREKSCLGDNVLFTINMVYKALIKCLFTVVTVARVKFRRDRFPVV